MRPPDPGPNSRTPPSPQVTTALVIAAVIMGPIMALQVGHWFEARSAGTSGLALLGILWALLATVVFLALGLVQRLRGEVADERPIVMGAQLTLMLLAGAVWTGIVVDQLPCFLGLPNCD